MNFIHFSDTEGERGERERTGKPHRDLIQPPSIYSYNNNTLCCTRYVCVCVQSSCEKSVSQRIIAVLAAGREREGR